MARSVSVRDLRNNTAEVVAAVQAGETLTLTVNRSPVADITPHVARRSPWVPVAVLHRILADAPADPGLMSDIADVRSALVDDPR